MSGHGVHVSDQRFGENVLNSEVPALVDDGAQRRGPCKTPAPAPVEAAESRAGQLKAAGLNIDDDAAISPQYYIWGIPAPALYKMTSV